MNINEYIEKYNLNKKDIILLDVREIEEFNELHINGAINHPLSIIERINDTIKNKDAIIYVYCRSGHRSGIAESYLKSIGYTNVVNIGGIIDYNN